uniref:NADH dehydrogenase subunit 2 n=1 Tax=Pulex irritans TaxID=173820 RepID=UPI0020295D50|nr:NADH dehydrogenase subunit 2 [Pulex irritans]UPV72695.1 NADH dehydrogenase subunit 2 [Pulex irritans]
MFMFSSILFFFMLILSTMICISSNSWLGAWIGLEINLLSFIPMMSNKKNSLSNESSLKYFLIQAFASILLLFFICLNFFIKNFFFTIYFNEYYLILLNSSLLLKLGAAPFHFWFPSVMEGLNWINNLILMTWQKINPLVCLTYCLNSNFFYITAMFSVILGSLGGLNNISIRKVIAYSSITHMGWMLISMTSNEMSLWFYFFIYSFISFSLILNFNQLKLFYFNQFLNNSISSLNKMFIMMMFLSMGGLPPFLGFFPKWIVIESMINSNLLIYCLIMVIMTLLTLFFYLRMSFSLFVMNNFQMYWNKKMNLNQFFLYWNLFSLIFPMLLMFMI